MPQVFFPLEVVFDRWRFSRTVESVMLEYDVDEHVARSAEAKLASYTLLGHVESVVPEKLKEEPRDRRIGRIMANLNEVVTSCLDKYLNSDGVNLLRGITKHADVTLFAQGHRHFYTEIVSGSSLKYLVNQGLRIVERTMVKHEMIVAIANKRLPSYYLDRDPDQLLAVGRKNKFVRLGLLNFDGKSEPEEAPWTALHSLQDVMQWLASEKIFVQKDVENDDHRFGGTKKALTGRRASIVKDAEDEDEDETTAEDDRLTAN
ncbi:MAG: hypothetical protein U0487_03825 [Patescibacteria group bacterium]